ncbi:uncharacterized protein BJX67DRAFT_77279 [Aspergillus lucknowensis]|uniref:Uncharacterized protein n=1 Tax=Aspergillus lucknowensis TaxID=176173 RepID=A0ABR4LTQ6_9EURO
MRPTRRRFETGIFPENIFDVTIQLCLNVSSMYGYARIFPVIARLVASTVAVKGDVHGRGCISGGTGPCGTRKLRRAKESADKEREAGACDRAGRITHLGAGHTLAHGDEAQQHLAGPGDLGICRREGGGVWSLRAPAEEAGERVTESIIPVQSHSSLAGQAIIAQL